MAGFLYRFVTDVVSEDELSKNRLRLMMSEHNNNMHVLVIDGDVRIVKDDQQDIHPTRPHHHVSLDGMACPGCVQMATDELYVEPPS